MQKVRLERAEKAIADFCEQYKECYGELMVLLHKYINHYFCKYKFSLNYRLLFRIITDQVRNDDKNNELYKPMKYDVEMIHDKYDNIFDNFSALVRRLVDMDSNGYNMLARLMYGESAKNILKETDAEEKKRQELMFYIAIKFLDIFSGIDDKSFSNGINKNVFIANFLIQLKTFDYDTLCNVFCKLKKSEHSIDYVEDLKSFILGNCNLTTTDIREEVPELIEEPSVADDIINHPDYKDEVIHLENTINEMIQGINELDSEISNIQAKQKALLIANDPASRMDLIVYKNIEEINSKKLLDIKSALDSPYFGRVDFKYDNNNEFETFYIGRIGFKQESKYGVIDWRTPIASIFYECENGRAKYEAPEGTFSGDVRLKRQYKIKDSQLISFTDDIIADKIAKTLEKIASKEQMPQKDDIISDPVLLEKLKQKSDKKLKDIIETIRAEQNKIIRQPLNKVLVVQGVAGSGKSTVGLHRISYLLYNNKGMDPGKILVVAPNKIFLDYIIDLLPGLDARGVKQLTFEQLAFNIIGTNLNIIKDEKIEFFVSTANANLYQFLKDAMANVSKFKGSLSFISLIDYIINKKANEIISRLNDVNLFEEKLKISRDEQVNYLKGNAPLNNRIVMLKNAIESKIRVFIQQQAFFMDNIDSLKQEAVKFLNSYLKNLKPIEPISVYKEIYEDDYVYKTLYKNRYFSFVAQYTLKILESGYVEKEDLAALCYIKYKTDGIRSAQKFLHIFVDEAQDLSPLEFVVLKLVSENNSMTIMGDMNQGINSHRGIESWDQLINTIYSDLKPQYFELLNSYRSTKDIVEFSNKLVLKNLPKAIPVARNGEKPTIEKFSSNKDGINKLIKMIKYYRNNGCQSIGILAKKERECRAIFSVLSKLEDEFSNINLIDDTTDKYNGGISIVPIVLSKGLEFDAVILWNASDVNFGNTEFDLKILYVAITRPMHYLHILYKGNITSHLKGFVDINTDNTAL